MSAGSRDIRYGRQGGSWLPEQKREAKVGPLIPYPNDLSAHLVHRHLDLAAANPTADEARLWHDADHARCGKDADHCHS